MVFMYTCSLTIFFHKCLLGNRSHKMYSFKVSIRSYLCRILKISGMNPFILFVGFHFHSINHARKIFRHGIPWLINIRRPRKYSLRLSISASIVSKPKSPREADPDVPGRKPCMTRTIMFCTFSNSDISLRFNCQSSQPYAILGMPIRLHKAAAITGFNSLY